MPKFWKSGVASWAPRIFLRWPPRITWRWRIGDRAGTIEAEALQSELNAVCSRVLGFDNSVTLIGMRTLALVYQSQGKFAQAEALLSKLLETMRHIPELRQLSIATVLNDLALADQSQGKYAEAEALLREGLAISDTKTPENWDSFPLPERARCEPGGAKEVRGGRTPADRGI